jgi:hypothetical protein
MQKLITNIVFTKNRPLQLNAYLESLYKYFPSELIKTYILYKAELFDEEYERLFREYSDCVVIKESDFHSDFLGILSKINTKYILFGIDDVVFFDSVDFEIIDETFREHREDIFGFTLRFGPDNEYLKNGGDTITDIMISDQTVYRLNWKDGQTPHSRYPFELCCTIYPTALVKKIIGGVMNDNPLIRRLFSPNSVLIRAFGKIKSPRSVLKSFGYFFSPNKLESWNCRWCQNHSNQLPASTYFQKLCAAAIQVNMVNTSTRNTSDGTVEHSVEVLNDKYKQGYRLDINFVAANMPTAPACGQQYFKLAKKYDTELLINS